MFRNQQIVVRVDKHRLLSTLKKNRENHIRVYDEAKEGYHQKVIEALETRLESIKANPGKIPDLHFYLRPPVTYRSSYDDAIQMLEWAQEEVIELTPDLFKQWVQDKWSWREGFYDINAAYSSTAAVLGVGDRDEDSGDEVDPLVLAQSPHPR